MKIGLISGHGNGDSGAVGQGTQEQKETRRVVNGIKKELSKYCDVVVYDQNKNAFDELQKGKMKYLVCDYLLEVHFNSFNGSAYGTECYVTTSEKATSVEKQILANLSKYFTNRGIKRTNFSVIYNYKQNRKISSALLEVCFIDNKKDMTTYNKNFDSICNQIALGIAQGFALNKKGGTTPKPTPKPVPKPDTTRTGTYKFKVAVKVRKSPDTASKYDTGVAYQKGETVIISQVLSGNMYTWGKYYTAKGQSRFVALKDNKKNVWYANKI